MHFSLVGGLESSIKTSGKGPRASAKLKQLEMRFPSLDKCILRRLGQALGQIAGQVPGRVRGRFQDVPELTS